MAAFDFIERKNNEHYTTPSLTAKTKHVIALLNNMRTLKLEAAK